MKTIVATMLLTFALTTTAQAGAGSQIFKAGARKNVIVRSSQTVRDHIEEGLKKVSAIPGSKHTVIDNTYSSSQNKLKATIETVIMRDGTERQALIIKTSEFYTPKAAKDATRLGKKTEVPDSLNHILEILPADADINSRLLKPLDSQVGSFRPAKISGDHDLKYTLVLDLQASRNGRPISNAEYTRRVNAVSEILTGIAGRLETRESNLTLSRASKAVKARTEK